MKTLLKVVLSLAAVVVLLGAGGFAWATSKSAALMARSLEVHDVDFPIPFPLDSTDVAVAGWTPEEARAVALERAVERGRHLVQSRYVCTECHGTDFGGGVMVDDPVIGTLLGPNITAGAGGRTADYTPADWDHIVRHGLKPGGKVGAMPSEDFQRMSDRELSDIVAYVRAQPPVDATVPEVRLGPLGTVLVATGAIPLSADLIGEHQARHATEAPTATVSVEFGRHLAGVCAGCHRADLTGGKVPGGDPSWPAAPNLTPLPDGLGAWTFDQFATTMREGRRPDGTELAAPMNGIVGYTRNMTDTELEALWTYVRSLPPTPTDD